MADVEQISCNGTPLDPLRAAPLSASTGIVTLEEGERQAAVDGHTATSAPAPLASAAVCFASGTRIRTPAGDIPVQDLKVGDLVITAAGQERPIRWLGHRTIDCRAQPQPNQALPIRISAGAFGAEKPSRDLYVSPRHAICFDLVGEVFIPASLLVNSMTVRQVEVDSVDYWHVELDSHDVLLAENQPAESYLDIGNRAFFADAGDDLGVADGPPHPYAAFCRPVHESGPVLHVVRAQIQARAQSLGWTFDSDPFADLHLLADGERIDAHLDGLSARFEVPPGIRELYVVSHTARPRDLWDTIDARTLGVKLKGVVIEDTQAGATAIAIDDPLLCVGLYEVESDNARWTTGQARLPSCLWAERTSGPWNLQIDLAGPALPRWVRPPAITPPPPSPQLPPAPQLYVEPMLDAA